MSYFKIDGNDYSAFVNELSISKMAKYNAQTNAAGNTVVDYINHKREINVGIIPLNEETMAALQGDIDNFNVALSFRNPNTGLLEENVNCIIPTSQVDYYTIQVGKVLFKAFKLKFIEL